mmetsp:Transcript_16731/g.37711  ORF Transcript_16731/g.37711 Transcript_16731/m.37711 type:complete len:294 (+) Transcript_16731:91-972(+)
MWCVTGCCPCCALFMSAGEPMEKVCICCCGCCCACGICCMTTGARCDTGGFIAAACAALSWWKSAPACESAMWFARNGLSGDVGESGLSAGCTIDMGPVRPWPETLGRPPWSAAETPWPRPSALYVWWHAEISCICWNAAVRASMCERSCELDSFLRLGRPGDRPLVIPPSIIVRAFIDPPMPPPRARTMPIEPEYPRTRLPFSRPLTMSEADWCSGPLEEEDRRDRRELRRFRRRSAPVSSAACAAASSSESAASSSSSSAASSFSSSSLAAASLSSPSSSSYSEASTSPPS